MGDILDADLDTLHGLGNVLAGHADAIKRLTLSDTIAMPNSPVQTATAQLNQAVVTAFGVIGDDVRQLSDASKAAAKTYEEVDQAFATQLHRYTSGG